ncbi:MAG: hypothetical protein E7614_04215 [Ruminococcaceae bacterium]|nr:hypothetical protein [Oscillospiraceae bacterium]
MVDFHTHIIPAIDDGAKTAEDSIHLLKSLKDLGMTQVVLSPHYYPAQEKIQDFISRRDASCKILAEKLEKSNESFPKLHLASEVYLEPIIFNNEDLTPLTVDMSGKFMLTELLYEKEFTNSTEAMIRQLVYSYNLVPILAHIDRYPFLMKEKNLYHLLEMGCVAQINLSSLTNFFQRKKLFKYLEKGYIGVIGSDIHNKSYFENVKAGLSYLREDDIEYITDVSKGILKKVKKDSDDNYPEIVVD